MASKNKDLRRQEQRAKKSADEKAAEARKVLIAKMGGAGRYSMVKGSGRHTDKRREQDRLKCRNWRP